MKKQTISARDKMFLPLDIQMFASEGADGSGENGDNGSNKGNTFSEADYVKLLEEHKKLKASFDKTSSDLAEQKKLLKSKQTDDEKKAEAEKEQQAKLEAMQKELTTYKIKTALASSFDEKEIETITEKILGGNIDELVKCLNETRKAYKEKIYAEAKKEFSQSANIPGGNGSGDDDSLGKQMAQEKAKQRSKQSQVSWGQFGNK